MTSKIYKIREFNESTGQVVISVEGYPGLIAVDLPIDENNNVPTDQDLHIYVNGFVPYGWIERKEKLKNPINNAEKIRALVEPLPSPEVNPTEPEPTISTIEDLMLRLEEIQTEINKLK